MSVLPILQYERRGCVPYAEGKQKSMVRAIFVLWWNVHLLIAGSIM
jgi:hypothetical protein